MIPLIADLLAAIEPPLQPPHFAAAFTSQPPVIDGKLDDDTWKKAPATSAFTQKFPNEAKAPLERTTLRILYDHEAIYVSFECVQQRTPIVQSLTRRDRQVESDRVTVTLDTRRDGKSAFEFGVNAAGVMVDGIRYNDTDYSSDWDENFDARTAITETGWTAEFRIPLRLLRFDTLPVQSWGLQARRYVSALQETDEWAFIPRNVAGEVSHYGRLDRLEGLRSGTPFELRPFVAGRLRRRDATDGQLASGIDLGGSAGLDLKWHPSQGLTLDVAVNPDFAQVEADQVILNLTKFETYYPERRPFFLEGIDTFATPLQLIYTRRIGRGAATPTLRTSAPFGEQLVDLPEPATIYAASKLTGRIADKWTIGTLQAITAKSEVDVQLADGSRQRRLVDPLTSFNALRLQRDLGTNAHIGFLGTAVTRGESVSGYPLVPGDGATPTTQLCPGGTTLRPGSRCFNDAYVASVDARWRSKSGEWAAGGQAVMSALARGPSRAIADGTIIQRGDVGTAVYAYAAKEGGEHWIGAVDFGYGGRKLDFSDMGFVERSNVINTNANLGYRTLKPWWITLETSSQLELNYVDNVDGLRLGRRVGFTTRGKLENFWTYSNTVSYRPPRFDDREVGDGTALERSVSVGHDFRIETNPAKRVKLTFRTLEQFLGNGLNWQVSAGALVRVLPQFDLELLPTATWTYGEPRFAASGADAGQYLFGRLDAKSLGATLRATYTFTPRLTLQAYSQIFLASGHYSEFSQLVADPNGPRPAIRLADLTPGPAPALNPDFAQGVLNVNVVLRWEYRLGSLLYVVYTRAQVPSVALAAGERGTLDLGAVQRAPAGDALLVKLSYWWGG